MSEAVKVAAEMAEREGRYRDELITESERYGIPDINLYNYYIRHRDYCNSMMQTAVIKMQIIYYENFK